MVATNAFGMASTNRMCPMSSTTICRWMSRAIIRRPAAPGATASRRTVFCSTRRGDVRTNRFLIEHSAPAEEVDEALAAQLRAGQEERLRRMTFYCHSKYCLRAELLRYFGERAPKECGHCSVCAPHAQRASLTHALASRAKKQSEAQAKAVDAGLLERLKEVRLAFAKARGRAGVRRVQRRGAARHVRKAARDAGCVFCRCRASAPKSASATARLSCG